MKQGITRALLERGLACRRQFSHDPRLEGSATLRESQVAGPASDHQSYGSWVSFSDPDGNRWFIQEVTMRLPGRVTAASAAYDSVADLAEALRRAAAAHGKHEEEIGQADPDWPDWYAQYMVDERNAPAAGA